MPRRPPPRSSKPAPRGRDPRELRPQPHELRPSGAPLEVTVAALGGLGDAVVRLDDGRVVLLPEGVPGDRLRIQLMGTHRGVARGRVLQVVVPSVDRVEPACPVASRCGGCTWQHVSLRVQRTTKLDAARRALGPDAAELRMDDRVPDLAHRRRVRLHLRRDPGGLHAGFMAKGSELLVATDACPVLEPVLAALLPRLGPVLERFVDQGEVHAVLGIEGVIAAVFAKPKGGAETPDPARLADALGLAGLRLQLGSNTFRHGLDEVTLPETLSAEAGEAGLPVRVDAAGFAQATVTGNQAIRQAVQLALDEIGNIPRCQEFYAGSGNLGVLLAGRTPELRVVEWDQAAADRARRALLPAQALGTRVTVLCGDAAELIEPAESGELWLLDPGRPGALEVCKAAVIERPLHLVYVSCALDTLARDLKVLRAAGYVQQTAVLIDTFPHTPHAEMVVRLLLS